MFEKNPDSFKSRCELLGINYSTAYDYKKNHPELTVNEVLEYYRQKKTDFPFIKELCEKYDVSYVSYLRNRRNAQIKYLSEKEEEERVLWYKEKRSVKTKMAAKIGAVYQNRLGLEYEIIKQNSDHTYDIRFLIDGTVVNGKTFDRIQKGVGHPYITRREIEDKSNREKYIGQKKKMNCGMEAEILSYEKGRKIVVRFADGTIKESTLQKFCRGEISHPSFSRKEQTRQKRIGLTALNSDGHMMELIDYNGETCTIKRDDGLIAENKTFQNFKKGTIHFDNVGRCFPLKIGISLKITGKGVRGNRNTYLGEFEDGVPYEHHINISSLKKGQASHPNLDIQRGARDFHGFDGRFAWKDEDTGKVYYLCKCRNCGIQDILTPQEMISHTCKN